MSAIRADIILIEAGKGATFIFDIRIHDVDAGYVEIPASSRQVVGIEPGLSRFKILIVDDNKDNRKLLLKLLEPFQFELNEAENGREAVEIWRDWRPDLIWMDIRMPVMDGYEAAKIIQEIVEKYPERPGPVIIAQTASSFEEDREAILDAGCDDFLRKPYKESDVF